MEGEVEVVPLPEGVPEAGGEALGVRVRALLGLCERVPLRVFVPLPVREGLPVPEKVGRGEEEVQGDGEALGLPDALPVREEVTVELREGLLDAVPAPEPLALRLRVREGVVVELEERLTVPQVEGVEVAVLWLPDCVEETEGEGVMEAVRVPRAGVAEAQPEARAVGVMVAQPECVVEMRALELALLQGEGEGEREEEEVGEAPPLPVLQGEAERLLVALAEREALEQGEGVREGLRVLEVLGDAVPDLVTEEEEERVGEKDTVRVEGREKEMLGEALGVEVPVGEKEMLPVALPLLLPLALLLGVADTDTDCEVERERLGVPLLVRLGVTVPLEHSVVETVLEAERLPRPEAVREGVLLELLLSLPLLLRLGEVLGEALMERVMEGEEVALGEEERLGVSVPVAQALREVEREGEWVPWGLALPPASVAD